MREGPVVVVTPSALITYKIFAQNNRGRSHTLVQRVHGWRKRRERRG
jgi:hypothetical protein